MAVMTWDSQLQAFVETEIPKTYNQQLEAWEDTSGYEYNHGLGAWEGRWPEYREVVLYDHGIFNVISQDSARNLAYGPDGYSSISGLSPLALTVKYNADNIEIVQNTTARYGTLFFGVPLDLSKYGALEIVCTTTANYFNPTAGFTQQIKDNYVASANIHYLGDGQKKELDISGLTGNYYLYFGTGRGYNEVANVMKVYKLTLKA